MNSFDAVVYLGLVVAVVTGFNAGLLRSAVTILAGLHCRNGAQCPASACCDKPASAPNDTASKYTFDSIIPSRAPSLLRVRAM